MEEVPRCFLNELFFGGNKNNNSNNNNNKKKKGDAIVIESPTRDESASPSEARIHSCPDCAYTTQRRGDMVKHTRIHSGVKPFVCDKCERAFTQSSHLRVHKIRIHSIQQQ